MQLSKMILLVTTALGLVMPPGAVALPQGASIFVSTAGSDSSGDGSIGNPFRTINHALTIAVAGDEIVLRGAPALTNNVYAESIRIERPNITIRSHTNEWAIIQCPINDESIGQCVRFDVDSDGSRLQRVEVVGGYYYGIKLETKWDWGDPNDRSGALNILLEDIKVHDTGRDAIKITPGCDDTTIRRAEIFNSGVRDNSNAEGIDNVNGDRMIVQDSYVHDIATNGIYFKGGSTDSVVERTRIERVGGAGVLVGFDTSPEFFDLTVNPAYYESIRGVVRNNIIRDAQGSGIGLYAAQDAQILNNTIIDTAKTYHSAIYFGISYQDWDPQAGRPPSVNPIIRNNIVHQSSGLPRDCVFIRYSNDLGGLSALSGMPDMDYNLYYHAGGSCLFTDQRPTSPLDHGTFSQWQAHIGGESHSLTSAPQLTGDGHLSAGSPAIDAGICTGAPTDDFDGDVRPQGGACDIGADEATSAPSTYTLTVIKVGSGSGTVTSNPPGINCGTDCFETFPAATSVTLTASADAGSSFAGWSGDPDCSDGVVTMTAHRTCTATFSLNSYTLTVSKAGTGSGTVTSSPTGITCGTSCSKAFPYNTRVTLTAAPEPGSSFRSWSGDCTGSSTSVEVLVTHNRICTATFDHETSSVIWLPVVANLGGVGGSYFYSDVVVKNLGTGVARVSLKYYPAGGSAVEVADFAEVGVGGQKVFVDVVGQLGKVGTKGVLRVRGTQPLLVVSRTYNQLSPGNSLGLSAQTTFGQYVEAYREEDAVAAGEQVYVVGLRQGVSYRTNLAVANVGSGPAQVRVTLYTGDGTQVAEYEVPLAPGQLRQDNEVFVSKAGLVDVASGWAKVQVLAGSGVIAYASVLDNVATAGQKPSDPTTMPMKRP